MKLLAFLCKFRPHVWKRSKAQRNKTCKRCGTVREVKSRKAAVP